jgi:hypothetical protein
MKLTSKFSLPQPESDDFANGALDLQILAEAVDTDIYNLQQSFTANLRTAAVISHATATYAVPIGQELLPFDNDASIMTFGSFVIDYQNVFTSTVLIPEQGSYLFGCYVNLIAGTPNLNTLRILQIGASVPAGPQFNTQKRYLFTETALEPNNGHGVFLSAMGQFDYQAVPNARPLRLWAGFSHNNTSSNVVMQAGAIFWAIKFSEIGD